MIKQISVENFYNFKNILTVDFTNSGNDDSLNYKYNKDFIGNFSLMYGKNNVGKSNFFNILKDAKVYVLEGDANFEYYRPNGFDKPSMFEIIIENDQNEIRYGFEIDVNRKIINDEWLFSKINGSSRESLIFDRNSEREEFKFSPLFKASEKKELENVRTDVLFLHHLSNKAETLSLIKELLTEFKEMTFISCILGGDEDRGSEFAGFISLYENEDYKNIINEFLKSADLDIVNIKFSELTASENEVLTKLRALNAEGLPEKERDKKIQKLISENKEVIPGLLSKNLLARIVHEGVIEPFSMEFIHRSGASYSFKDLSSGSKQIISILIRVIDKIGKKSVLIFDEIETALHFDLTNLLVEFFRMLIQLEPQQQYIITTHQEELLDYEFISNENKIFLKYNTKSDELYVDYLSNYRLREYQVPSKRYKLDAFETNPNTSSQYNLKSVIQAYAKEQKKIG